MVEEWVKSGHFLFTFASFSNWFDCSIVHWLGLDKLTLSSDIKDKTSIASVLYQKIALVEPTVNKWLDALVVVLSYPVAKLEQDNIITFSIITNSFWAFCQWKCLITTLLAKLALPSGESEPTSKSFSRLCWCFRAGGKISSLDIGHHCVDVSEQAAKLDH